MSPDAKIRALKPEGWVAAYGDYLYRYAMSRLRDPEAAEEVVQEAFVSGLKAADQYSGRGAERAWLLGILKRKIIDHYRRRQRTGVQAAEDTDGDISEMLFDERGFWKREVKSLFGASPSAGLESVEFWAMLKVCLESLPRKQADVFTLREIDEKPGSEICKELEITPSNLWVLLHRARLRLATCVRNQWADSS